MTSSPRTSGRRGSSENAWTSSPWPTRTGPRRAPATRQSASTSTRSSDRVSFRLRGSPGTTPHSQPAGLDQTGVVARLGPGRWAGRQHVGPERLRRLDRHQLPPFRPLATTRSDPGHPFEGVGHRHGGDAPVASRARTRRRPGANRQAQPAAGRRRGRRRPRRPAARRQPGPHRGRTGGTSGHHGRRRVRHRPARGGSPGPPSCAGVAGHHQTTRRPRAGRRAPTRRRPGARPGGGTAWVAEPTPRAGGHHDGPDGPVGQGSASLRRTSAVSSSTPRAKVSSDTRIWRARLSMRFSPADRPLSLSRIDRFRTTSATW